MPVIGCDPNALLELRLEDGIVIPFLSYKAAVIHPKPMLLETIILATGFISNTYAYICA